MRRAPPPVVCTVQRARRHTPRQPSPRPNPPVVRWVYVIELDPEAARKGHQEPNGYPALYVGQTGLTPRERFAQHRRGGMYGSDVVRRFGRRLIPELTSGPYGSIPEAEAAERDTAARLASEGWRVLGGH